jgi:replication factor C subunit 3/5
MALLREIFGPGVERVRLEHRSLKTPSNRTVDVATIGSNYHIECNPSDAGNNDRFVVQEVIKEVASHGVLYSGGTDGTTGASARTFKVVVLTEADRLSRQAQASLRRTMEKYSSVCRIVLLCESPSKIIDPVRSRCLGVRVPAPSHDEVAAVLTEVARRELPTPGCPRDLALRISAAAGQNLRRALLMLESCAVQQSPLAPDQPVALPDWELYICRLAREILQDQSPGKLLQARDMIYELLTNCIPADVIIRTLTRELCKSLDDGTKHELVHWAAHYEHRVQLGSKDVFHLEAFVAKFMAIYKRWLIQLFA